MYQEKKVSQGDIPMSTNTSAEIGTWREFFSYFGPMTLLSSFSHYLRFITQGSVGSEIVMWMVLIVNLFIASSLYTKYEKRDPSLLRADNVLKNIPTFSPRTMKVMFPTLLAMMSFALPILAYIFWIARSQIF
jgi:hypothetical protein